MMFDNYEALNCDICKKAFTGRKPNDGGRALCPDCIDDSTIAIITEKMTIPNSVVEEFSEGRGSDE